MVQSDGQVGRWFHGEHARHVRQSGRLSSESVSGPRIGLSTGAVVVVFCLATGVVLESAIGPARGKKTGENTLFRSLWDSLDRGDVVLADRCYCSYFDIAMLKRRGIDVVFRLHQQRKCDFRCGRRLGREDQIVTWTRPGRPAWMDEATYEQVPETLEVRQLRVRVQTRGFRTRVLDVVTTLLDAEIYTKAHIASLYRQRWHAELDLPRSRSSWAWTCCDARRRRWSARRSA